MTGWNDDDNVDIAADNVGDDGDGEAGDEDDDGGGGDRG